MNTITRRTKLMIWAGLGMLLVLASLLGARYVGLLGPQPTVQHLIANNDIDAVDVTSELCGDGRLRCVEAWRTDVGDYLRFDAAGPAKEWANILGDDGRRWKSIVLDMHEHDLTFDQRRHAIEILFSYHDWG